MYVFLHKDMILKVTLDTFQRKEAKSQSRVLCDDRVVVQLPSQQRRKAAKEPRRVEAGGAEHARRALEASGSLETDSEASRGSSEERNTKHTHIQFLFLKTATTTQANSVCFDYLFCHLQLNLILLSGLLSVLFIYQTNIGDAFIELAKNNYKNNLFQSQQYLRMFLVLEQL